MPIYEFCCTDCGIYFEELVSLNAADNPPCPRCRQSAHVQRTVSGFSIRPGGRPMTHNQMRKKAYGDK